MVTEAQWDAARRMMGCEPPTLRLTAGVMGVTVRAVELRAEEESWPRFDFRLKESRAAWRDAMDAAKAAGLRKKFGLPAIDAPGGSAWMPGGGGAAADGGEGGPQRRGAEGTEGAVEPFEARFARVMGALLDEVEAVGLTPGRWGAGVDRERMGTLWTVIRTLERAERFLPSGPAAEGSGEDAAERSRKAAEVLARIDERVFELAYAIAKDMVEEGRHGGGSGGVSGGVAAGPASGAGA
jgi:hypothetical protein